LVLIVLRKQEQILTAPFRQFARQDQEICANGIQRGVEILFGQAEPFEPMHQVVSEQQELKEGYIRHPIVGRDFAQGIVVEQFANILLDRGVWSLEPPPSPGMGSEVGHQNVVGKFVVLEKRPLPGFDRVLRNGTTDHSKAVWMLPGVGLITELSHLPPRAQFPKLAIAGPPLDRGVFLGHHSVATPARIEEFHEPLAEASGIGPDAGPSDGGGHFVQTTLNKGHHAGGRHRMAGPQRALPELLPMSLEANDRGVGTSAVFLGVVPDASKWLLAIDGEDHRIEIEGEGSPPSGQRKELSAQADELTDGVGTHSLEESAQGRLVGEAREAQQRQEGTVVLQNFCLVDASQARHDGVQERQNQVGGAVVGIALRSADMLLEEPTQPEFVAKTLQ